MINNKLFQMLAVGASCIILAIGVLCVGAIANANLSADSIPDDEIRELDPNISVWVINNSTNRQGVAYIEPNCEIATGFVFNAGTGRYYDVNAIELGHGTGKTTLTIADTLEPTNIVGIYYTARYMDVTRQIVRVELSNIDTQYVGGGARSLNLTAYPSSAETGEVTQPEPTRILTIYQWETNALGKVIGPFQSPMTVIEGNHNTNFNSIPQSPKTITHGGSYSNMYFAGWYLDPEFERPFTFETKEIGNVEKPVAPMFSSGYYTLDETSGKLPGIYEYYKLDLYAHYVQNGFEAVYIGKTSIAQWDGKFLARRTIERGDIPTTQIGRAYEYLNTIEINPYQIAPYYVDTTLGTNGFECTVDGTKNAINTRLTVANHFTDGVYRAIVYVNIAAPEHTLSYDVNGGLWTDDHTLMSQKIKYGTRLIEPRAPLGKNGYKFDYWYEKNSRVRYFSGLNVDPIMANQSITLVAHYSLVSSDAELKAEITKLRAFFDQELDESKVSPELYAEWLLAYTTAKQYVADGEITLNGLVEWQKTLNGIQSRATGAVIQRNPQTAKIESTRETLSPMGIACIIAGCIIIFGTFVILTLDKLNQREVK